MAGARALRRATGMHTADFEKPIIAVANSFTQFVPGHVHLKDLGQLVCREIEAAGGVAKEFNTIAVDDGIAMGHDGMLYSLPSREIIADSVEYMVNAHCADALVCISNCDKITPGMLMAALRLNTPTVFVSGGPMEAGKTKLADHKLDLVDAMVVAANDSISDEVVEEYERSACPTCGSCSGMFTANSMNCLTEAIGLSLPGNGTVLATHFDRKDLFLNAAKTIVSITRRYYEQDGVGQGLCIVDRRSLLRRDFGSLDWSCFSRGGIGRQHCSGQGRRSHPNRHPQSPHQCGAIGGGISQPSCGNGSKGQRCLEACTEEAASGKCGAQGLCTAGD